ncbi:hypothetical protein YC2023_107751 [Brassica napus]
MTLKRSNRVSNNATQQTNKAHIKHLTHQKNTAHRRPNERKKNRFSFSAESRFTPERFIGTNIATRIPAGNRVTIIKPSSSQESQLAFYLLCSKYQRASIDSSRAHPIPYPTNTKEESITQIHITISRRTSSTISSPLHQNQSTEPSPLNGYKTRGLWLRAGGAEHREPPPPESLKSDDSTEEVENHRNRGRLHHVEETTVYQKL